jgi:hypothetical protein
MNCTQWEERLALLAGGEAPDHEAEWHVAECPGCAALLAELRADHSLLASTELPWGAAEALRARVMERLGSRRRVWWWIPAPAAAAAALVWMLWPDPRPVAPPAVAVWRAPAPEVRGCGAGAFACQTAPSRLPRERPLAGEATTEFVKLLTDDEDVVILWAMDAKGDTR